MAARRGGAMRGFCRGGFETRPYAGGLQAIKLPTGVASARC